MSTTFLKLKEELAKLKERNSIIADLRRSCQNEWEFYDLLKDLMDDEDFKRACIEKFFSESCKRELDHHIELAKQAEKVLSKYFEKKDVELQAYYTEASGPGKILSINLTNYDKNEPVRISDILQQEKNINELNVYYNKKHEIYVYQENKKRHYEFKEDAHYEMTSAWSIKNDFGKVISVCTMVMSVSSSGITEIIKFDGGNLKPSLEDFWKLIGLNKELYIQNLSLHDAVRALLEKNKNVPLPGVIPASNVNIQNSELEPTVNNKDKEIEKQEVYLKWNADSLATQREIGKLDQQSNGLKQKLKKNEEKVTMQRKKVKRLKRRNSGLQSELEKERQENKNLQAELKQKNEKLASISASLQKKIQELENMCEEKERLKEKKEDLISALEKLKVELGQLKEKRYVLEDNLDQLELFNKKLEEEREQLLEKTLGLEKVLLLLREEMQALSDGLNDSRKKQAKSNQELAKAKQKIEKLEDENNSLQFEHEKKEQRLKEQTTKIYEEIIQVSEEREQKVHEFFERNKELEKKLKFVNVQNRRLKNELEESRKLEQQTFKETELIIDENYKIIHSMRTQLQKLEQKNQEISELYAYTIEKSEYKIEELTNELELKNEQVKKQKGQLEREIEEIEKECLSLLELKFKEDAIEILKGRDKELEGIFKELRKIVIDKIQKTERIRNELCGSTEEIENLNKQMEYLKDQSAFHSVAIDDDNNGYISPSSFVNSSLEECSALSAGYSKCNNHSSIYP